MTIAGRRVAAVATDALCLGLGRRAVIRAARYVLLRARLDYPNEIAVNGESALQRWVLGLAPDGQIHVADVGANVGLWSRSMLAAASAAGRADDLRLHAFEPDAWACARLARTLDGAAAAISAVALSDRQGSTAFHVIAPGAGTNSLHPSPAATAAAETVPTVTLDSYAERSGVARFALVKIDTEGHDLSVLRGARSLLAEHRITVVQFEYNHRWVFARAFLRDAFDFLADLGYQIGKLTPKGVEFYPGWDADLETFVEGNYVACDPALARRLPVVPWWKEWSAGEASLDRGCPAERAEQS
jgi:FkbM family methyltransferase